MNNAQHIMRADVDWLLAAESTAERIMRPRSEGPLAKLIEDFRKEIEVTIQSPFAKSLLRSFPFANVAFSPNKFAKMGSLMQALLAHFVQICLALNSYKFEMLAEHYEEHQSEPAACR